MSTNLDAFGDLPLLLQVAFIFTVAGSALLFAVHALLRCFGFSPATQRWALPAVGTALGAIMILPVSYPSALGLVGLAVVAPDRTNWSVGWRFPRPVPHSERQAIRTNARGWRIAEPVDSWHVPAN